MLLHLETEAVSDTRARFDSCATPPSGTTDPFNQTRFSHIKHLCCFLACFSMQNHPTCCSGAPKQMQQLLSVCTLLCSSRGAVFPFLQCTSRARQHQACGNDTTAKVPLANKRGFVNEHLHLLNQEYSTLIRKMPSN